MSRQELARQRRPWQALSAEEKQAVLVELRLRQRAQIELEVRELQLLRRR